jgi:hypothetical protein
VEVHEEEPAAFAQRPRGDRLTVGLADLEIDMAAGAEAEYEIVTQVAVLDALSLHQLSSIRDLKPTVRKVWKREARSRHH